MTNILGRFLYSKVKLLEFFSYPKKENTKIFSISMDGQKVFIVKFNNDNDLEEFDSFTSSIDPTLLGEKEFSKYLQKETIKSLEEYLNEKFS